MAVTPEYLTQTVSPVCARPLNMAALEHAELLEKMEKVKDRLYEININKDETGIPLVRAFIGCNPASALDEMRRLHAEMKFSFETKIGAPKICRSLLIQFGNGMGGPGGTGRELKEHFLNGKGVANTLSLLRSQEFKSHVNDNTKTSQTANTAGILLTLLFNVSNVDSLLERLRNELRCNNFLDALTPFAASTYVLSSSHSFFIDGRIIIECWLYSCFIKSKSNKCCTQLRFLLK